MNIIVGADHRGFILKQDIKGHLLQKGYTVIDAGDVMFNETDDYPDYAHHVAIQIQKDPSARGVVVCGSGIGVSIAANKVPTIRCGLASTPEQVEAARADDDINILALASDFTSKGDALEMVETFLNTPFEANEKHVRRLEKITAIENQHGTSEK